MLGQSHPHLADFESFLADFNKETDRGSALAAAAMVDDLLEKTLRAFLIENKGGHSLTTGFNAPLGSFSARIAAAFALGLILEPEYRECELIRKIRNDFAHTVKVSFDDSAVADRCRELSFSAKDYDEVVVSIRGKFQSAVVSLILNLTNRPHYVGRKALKPREWPY